VQQNIDPGSTAKRKSNNGGAVLITGYDADAATPASVGMVSANRRWNFQTGRLIPS